MAYETVEVRKTEGCGAEVLGIEKSSVGTTLSRARRRLAILGPARHRHHVLALRRRVYLRRRVLRAEPRKELSDGENERDDEDREDGHRPHEQLGDAPHGDAPRRLRDVLHEHEEEAAEREAQRHEEREEVRKGEPLRVDLVAPRGDSEAEGADGRGDLPRTEPGRLRRDAVFARDGRLARGAHFFGSVGWLESAIWLSWSART